MFTTSQNKRCWFVCVNKNFDSCQIYASIEHQLFYVCQNEHFQFVCERKNFDSCQICGNITSK